MCVGSQRAPRCRKAPATHPHPTICSCCPSLPTSGQTARQSLLDMSWVRLQHAAGLSGAWTDSTLCNAGAADGTGRRQRSPKPPYPVEHPHVVVPNYLTCTVHRGSMDRGKCPGAGAATMLGYNVFLLRFCSKHTTLCTYIVRVLPARGVT